jgi:hypothetical protein
MLERIGTLPEDLGKPETLLADTGYFSEANVALCAAAQIDPMIAQGRQSFGEVPVGSCGGKMDGSSSFRYRPEFVLVCPVG